MNEHPFSITTEVTSAPWNPDHRLVRIALQGRRVDLDEQPASNLLFLLDVSGSMNSPDKLPLLKDALGLLVNNLREKHRVAIVVYAGAAGLVLESTSGDQKEVILDAIEIVALHTSQKTTNFGCFYAEWTAQRWSHPAGFPISSPTHAPWL